MGTPSIICFVQGFEIKMVLPPLAALKHLLSSIDARLRVRENSKHIRKVVR